jgi:mono/diheme cytochrome c family protein
MHVSSLRSSSGSIHAYDSRGTMKVLRNNLLFRIFAFALVLAIIPVLAGAQDSAGANVYKAKCVTCHAKDGSGNTPVGKSLQSADLRSPEVQKKSDAELTTSISEGKGNMPAFKTLLSEDEIHSVLSYVRTLAGKSDAPPKKK